MIKKALTILLLIPLAFLLLVSVTPVFAVDDTTTQAEEDADKVEDLQEKIEKYEEEIDKLQGEAASLSREINTANTQINITTLKIQNSIKNIERTEKEISRLSGDIDSLKERIDQLTERVEYQQDVLKERIIERYKTRETSTFMVLFGTNTLDALVKKSSYLKVMELQDNKVLTQMRNTQKTYNRQKDLYEDKKDDEVALQAQLLQEKANLDSYRVDLEREKAEKDRLLSITSNSEAKYQEMLLEAKRELDSYSSFVASTGQGIIGPNGLGGGEGGWYYSQRDSRWAYDKIGNSNYTVYNSGCLVSSVSMVHKYYGFNVDPGDLASKNQYYFWGDMLIPWPAPGGRQYSRLGYGYPRAAIDNELDDDNPVIVELRAANAAGTHFIVLVSGSNGDYEMHDPIYGPNLDFGDYYSTAQILSAVAFK